MVAWKPLQHRGQAQHQLHGLHRPALEIHWINLSPGPPLRHLLAVSSSLVVSISFGLSFPRLVFVWPIVDNITNIAAVQERQLHNQTVLKNHMHHAVLPQLRRQLLLAHD